MPIDSTTLSALASEPRRRILRLVKDREVSAGDVASHFDITWPAVSQHLRVLKDAGLVRERRDGRRRLYSTDSATLGVLEGLLEEMWRADLDRLAGLAEAEERP